MEWDVILTIIVMGLIFFGIDMLVAKINPTAGRIVSVLTFFVFMPVGLAAGIVALVCISKKAKKVDAGKRIVANESEKVTSVTIPQKAAVTQTAKKNADVTEMPAKKTEPKKEKYPTKRRRIADDTKATSCVPKASTSAPKPNPGDEKEWKLEYATSIDDLHMRMIGYPFPESDDQNKQSEKLIELVIPEGTTEIRDCEFKNRKDIASVVIPKSIKRVGGNAFEGCDNLKSVHISSLETWCNIQFENWGSNPLICAETLYVNGVAVNKFIVPEGIKEIQPYVFCGYKGLEELVISVGVTKIGYYAFYECENLKSVVIPNSIERIGYAFKGCDNLKSVHISSLETWCNIQFKNWGSNPLTCAENLYVNGVAVNKFIVPEGIKEIKPYVFYGYKGLKEIIIPESVTKISYQAFYGCKNLKSVVIPKGVTVIESGAFIRCEKLTAIEIPKGVTKIESYTFEECTNLKSIVIPKGVTVIECGAFYGCGNLAEVKIPEGVTQIDERAFESCKKLKTMVIPDSVKEIGERAFEDCISLNSIVLSKGIKVINYGAFRWCKNLTKIIIPDGVTEIGGEAFRGCENLRTIVVPDSVRGIGKDATIGCVKLDDNCRIKVRCKEREPVPTAMDLECMYIDPERPSHPPRNVTMDDVIDYYYGSRFGPKE